MSKKIVFERPYDLSLSNKYNKRHDFLSLNHQSNEIRTWCVISLCASSMIIEIICGSLFGSLALIADGIHMSTHTIAFGITASAYSISRKYRNDPRFVFGTGKIGELAAYTSAIILLGISIYIIYDGLYRFVYPQEIVFVKALIVSFVGLSVNIASGFILGMGNSSEEVLIDGKPVRDHDMAHGHGHGHSHGHVAEIFDYDSDIDDEMTHQPQDESFYIKVSVFSSFLLIYISINLSRL